MIDLQGMSGELKYKDEKPSKAALAEGKDIVYSLLFVS